MYRKYINFIGLTKYIYVMTHPMKGTVQPDEWYHLIVLDQCMNNYYI
jgi:hypothetical protein